MERELQEVHEIIGVVLAVRDREREDAASTEELLDALADLERAREVVGNLLSDEMAQSGSITKVYKGGYGSDACYAGQIDVEHIVMENEGYEDSAWTYIRTICEEGCYDDSDWGSEVFCWYYPTDGVQAVFDEAVKWYESHADIVAEFDLENPQEWTVMG